MQAVQLATALLALAAVAGAFPGYGGTSHVTQSLGVGGIGGGHGNDGGYGGNGGHDGHEDYYAHPEYKFDYAVHDPHTGDVKSQSESRHGDAVKGSYTIHDADGHVRTVDYSADKHTGFQAVVRRAGKTTLHGYGDADEQNNAVGHAGASYSSAVNHGSHYGKGGGDHGYGAGIGHAQVSFGGHGHDY